MLGHVSRTGLCLFASGVFASGAAAQQDYTVKQIRFGPKHHLFGYIGHAQTIPWNASGRYILALQADFDDQVLFGAYDQKSKTRQLYLLTIRERR